MKMLLPSAKLVKTDKFIVKVFQSNEDSAGIPYQILFCLTKNHSPKVACDRNANNRKIILRNDMSCMLLRIILQLL